MMFSDTGGENGSCASDYRAISRGLIPFGPIRRSFKQGRVATMTDLIAVMVVVTVPTVGVLAFILFIRAQWGRKDGKEDS